jgi:undecaprenyl phosphate-alpha-L-ara4FN deformylase
MSLQLAIKIDVDTEIGTGVGIPNLLALLKDHKIPATFYLSLGPDNTGRAIKRIFRKDFFKKVFRTNVVGTYGIRTLLNGVLWPGPHIGHKHEKLLRIIKEEGFAVGIHCYDHQKWQDGVRTLPQERINILLQKALDEFKRIFGFEAVTAAAPGWQANEKTFAAYDHAKFKYASDCRGFEPFYPEINGKVFKTLQIPTTLPTLDELLGRPEFPLDTLTNYYFSLLKSGINVITIHSELEGMKYFDWFRSFLIELKKRNVHFSTLDDIAKTANSISYPVCEVCQEEVTGRSGKLAKQKLMPI